MMTIITNREMGREDTTLMREGRKDLQFDTAQQLISS